MSGHSRRNEDLSRSHSRDRVVAAGSTTVGYQRLAPGGQGYLPTEFMPSSAPPPYAMAMQPMIAPQGMTMTQPPPAGMMQPPAYGYQPHGGGHQHRAHAPHDRTQAR